MYIEQAMKELEAGNTLCSGRSLLKQRGSTVLVSTDGWTARLSLSDFASLWAGRDFVLHTPPLAVDEASDAQYYRKLRYRQ
ncbi:hypothetical protein [Faecalibaculum rodentium]|uniref:hypothetical protein n=1 Tax=Faecalibaculum rodentium TaxID=1702221 RepID=UPI0023F47EB0|nr:hypothetical protein [Faecalibaculum rodentium]